MKSSDFQVTLVYIVLTVLALTTRNCLASSAEANSTQATLEDDDDDALSEMTFAEFKERYRRLIPYMTFFVANNYVNGQTPLGQVHSGDVLTNTLLRKTQSQTLVRTGNLVRRPGNKYYVNTQNQEKKFIPSMQYDPKNIGGDNDYFTPVRYTSKINYQDYPGPYQLYQSQKVIYPEITTPANEPAQKENRYFANVRPLRPYATNVRDHYPRKPSAKPIQANIQDDYILDYTNRPSGNPTINYANKEFEGLRYIPSPAHFNVAQPVKILEQVPGRQPPAIPQIHRNPSANLNRIVESFQLSERLPEMLNKDNIDNSIKTLVEILNILHSSKKEDFPQIQPPPLPPLAQPPPLPRFPPKLPAYDNFKLRPQTRPKVITETRFQVTPSPLLLTDDPERYKSTSYTNNLKPKVPLQSPYNVNSLNNDKPVDYSTSYTEDISEGNKDMFQLTSRPYTSTEPTEHSYEITEDLSDDILQDERFTLPTSTEDPSNNYAGPNEISSIEPTVPQTSLKYGVTRGKPNVDYPAYATIPETSFSCKEQRYKGFFGDPATGCQVWHYCDLNGGKSSFLCPNGTIFSQVALTCDWWFNVKCETTTQLYVLNERLYKYILPLMPKFPEDFTGPEVDRYLEIKFKEMEAKLREKKLKKQQEEKEKLKNKLQTLNENQ